MIASLVLYVGIALFFFGAVCTARPVPRFGFVRPLAIRVALAAVVLAAGAVLWPARLQKSRGAASEIDRLMPEWHFSEFHETHVAAPPDRVWAAVKEVRGGEIRFLPFLTGLRSLNISRMLGRDVPPPAAQLPILQVALRGGFVLLAEESPREIVLGTCGAFWWGGGRCPEVDGREPFLSFSQPGYAKATINYLVAPAPGGSRLTTETRVVATDPGALRRFSAYWRFIYPGSALIRRSWLAAVRRRAEAHSYFIVRYAPFRAGSPDRRLDCVCDVGWWPSFLLGAILLGALRGSSALPPRLPASDQKSEDCLRTSALAPPHEVLARGLARARALAA